MVNVYNTSYWVILESNAHCAGCNTQNEYGLIRKPVRAVMEINWGT